MTDTATNFNPFLLRLLDLGCVASFAKSAPDVGKVGPLLGVTIHESPICRRIVQTLVRGWAAP